MRNRGTSGACVLVIAALGCTGGEGSERGGWALGDGRDCAWYEAHGKPCPWPGEPEPPEPPCDLDAGLPDPCAVVSAYADGSGGADVVVRLEGLDVEVDTPSGARVVRVPVPVVDVEVTEPPPGVVPTRAHTPVVEVQLPVGPPSRVLTPVTEVDADDVCPAPGVVRRLPVPVVDVDLGDVTPQTARRVRVPAFELEPVPGVDLVARRARIPATEQDVPDGLGGVVRVRTPAIDVQLPPPGADVPTRVRVTVPSVDEEAGLRRVPVPVSPICPPT